MAWASGLSIAAGAKTANLMEFYVFGSTDAGKNLVDGGTNTATLLGAASYGTDGTIGTFVRGNNASSADGLQVTNSGETQHSDGEVFMVVFSRSGSALNEGWFCRQNTSSGGGVQLGYFGGNLSISGGGTEYNPSVPVSGIADSVESAVIWDSATGRVYLTGRTDSGGPHVPAGVPMATASFTSIYFGRRSFNDSGGNNLRVHAYARWSSNSGISTADFQSIADNPQQLLAAPAPPSPPTGVTSGSVTPTSATCSWTDASSDETSFDVQYAPSPYTSWTTLSGSPTAANATSLATGSVLTDGTSYKFRVRATNANGSSSWVESGVFTTTSLTRLRPSADTSNSGWTASTGSTLYTTIDESVADDGDYISTASTGTYKTKLQSASDPGSNLYHKVKVRARKSSGTLTIQLVQGDPTETTIASTAIAASASFAEYSLSVAEAEAANITDYGSLYVKVIAS